MHAGQTVAAAAFAMTTAMQSALTPAYAAPEVIKQEAHAKAGEKADVFGFGVCLFVAVFGELPQRDAVTHCLSASTKSKLCSDARSAAQELLQKLLADDPTDRPSADQALLHRYFSDTHEVSLKVDCTHDKHTHTVCTALSLSQNHNMRRWLSSTLDLSSTSR